MENNQNNQPRELEQMQQQMNLLKKKLQKHALINEGMLKRKVASNFDNFRNKMMFNIILGTVELFLLPYILINANFSMLIVVFVELIIALASIYAIYAFIFITKSKNLDADLLTMGKRIVKYARIRQFDMIIELILILFCFSWVFIEMSLLNKEIYFFVVIGSSSFVGILVSFILYNSNGKKVKEISDSIKMLEQTQD